MHFSWPILTHIRIAQTHLEACSKTLEQGQAFRMDHLRHAHAELAQAVLEGNRMEKDMPEDEGR